MKVYIAISEEDQDRLEEDICTFASFLRREGLQVTTSWDAPPGTIADSWTPTAVAEADCVLLVVTPSSAWGEGSYEDAVTLDVAAAHHRTLPLLLNDAEALDIPYGFRRLFFCTGYVSALPTLRRLRAKLEG